jgi:phospholipid-binding lipoprotein MlaA
VTFAVLSFGRARCAAAAALVACLLFGCVKPPTDPAERAAFEQTNDPLEPMNRKILDVNMVFDKFVLRPLAKVYVTVLPDGARAGIHRMLDNLKEPVIVVNNVLEGRPKAAGITVGRFAVNTTIGIGGLADVAAKWGLDEQPADFGQTLYVWGFSSGPYLVLPILGPSNPRDAIGMGADAFLDPLSYVGRLEHVNSLQIGRFVLGGIDQRARVLDVLDDLQKSSLDFYAQLRSLSEQQRSAELNPGKPPEPGGLYNEPGKAGPTAAPAAVAPAAPVKPPPSPAAAPAGPSAAPPQPQSPTPKPSPPVSGPAAPAGVIGAAASGDAPPALQPALELER